MFRLDDTYALPYLKKMTPLFGMKWNFVTVRYGRRISCNRAKRYEFSNTLSRRKTSSITYGWDWVIIFKNSSTKYRVYDSVDIV